MSQQALVIGAGAIGVAAAYYLKDSGWKVSLIDSGEVGEGCSYANACLITPSHSGPIPGPGVIRRALRWTLQPESPFYVRPRWDPDLLRWGWSFRRYCNRKAAERGFQALLRLSRLSLELFEELKGEIDFYYERKGLLHVYLTVEGLEEAERERHVLTEAGFNARLLSREETRKLEPALSDRICGGLFIEGEAHGLCLGYVRALARRAASEGVQILTGRAVHRIWVEAGKVKGVEVGSPEERLGAELVVLAAGSWSQGLARTLGVSIPLQPAKGYSCSLDQYPGGPKLPILMPERRVIVTPLQDRLRFAGTLELAGFNLTLDERRYQAVVRAGREVLRAPVEMKNEASWCGLRPCLPDGLPLIDWAPGTEGLLVATGHAMLGFTQSPGTGRVVAELASGKTPSVPLDAFRFRRF